MFGFGKADRHGRGASIESLLAQASFEHSPDGILLMQNGVFTACNRAAEKLYDRSRDQIIGHSPVEFSATAQGDGRSSIDHVTERMGEAQRSGFSRFEWLNLDRHGQVCRILVTLIPTRVTADGDVMVLVQSLAETSEVIDTLRHGLKSLSGGDLACHIRHPFRADYEGLRESFNAAVDSIAASLSQVLRTAQMVAAGSEEIQRAALDLSQRTEQQASSVERAAKALGEIGAAMSDSADAATNARNRVADTRRDAEDSGAVVARTVEAMAAIETSSREISEIITVIDGIAFQTNLLALNAGVEAARAGDAGRGFAVVASEVRALAQRSADAAKDIKARIQSSAHQVANGVELVTQTGAALTRIADGVAGASQIITHIAEDTNREARHIAEVNVGVGDIDRITQSNAAMAEEASAAARSLAGEAADLMQSLDRFRLGTSGTRSGGALRRVA